MSCTSAWVKMVEIWSLLILPYLAPTSVPTPPVSSHVPSKFPRLAPIIGTAVAQGFPVNKFKNVKICSGFPKRNSHPQPATAGRQFVGDGAVGLGCRRVFPVE